jgi:hypothetical protein
VAAFAAFRPSGDSLVFAPLCRPCFLDADATVAFLDGLLAGPSAGWN